METGIEKAIKVVGSGVALAEKCGVSPMAVSKWRHRRIPAERVIAVEQATNGAVTRAELRPDLYPPNDKNAEPPHPLQEAV